jgi:hypothetical protein
MKVKRPLVLVLILILTFAPGRVKTAEDCFLIGALCVATDVGSAPKLTEKRSAWSNEMTTTNVGLMFQVVT